ncbi:hypothetical protein C1H46_045820 [Malus baccata]|uniref:Uncharacterized protein n=1 Tax=Malus baccata TaxID=106549 RepID=A0A540K2Y3_MALBA|nr:hypothetical protein C1H46_045820 [Malus baccata]
MKKCQHSLTHLDRTHHKSISEPESAVRSHHPPSRIWILKNPNFVDLGLLGSVV